MRNPTKFGSLNLDTPSSRYEFLKLVFKSVKIYKKFKAILRMTDGPTVNGTHPSANQNRGGI